MVLFFSHIPHRGAKERADLDRSNIVVHYQCAPMHKGIWHVSEPLIDPGIFPVARGLSATEQLQFYTARIFHRSFLHELHGRMSRLLRRAFGR